MSDPEYEWQSQQWPLVFRLGCDSNRAIAPRDWREDRDRSPDPGRSPRMSANIHNLVKRVESADIRENPRLVLYCVARGRLNHRKESA
jgi:hypothetical protein